MTVPYQFANATGSIPLAELDANFAAVSEYSNTAGSALTAGTVTATAQPNIASVGILNSLSVTGNVTGNYFVGNGSQLTGITVTTSYGNSNVALYLLTNTGNIAAGNISATGTVQGNTITGTSLLSTGVVSATGTATAGNINTGGVVSATGNITGNYILGNGSQLTGVSATTATTAVTVTGNAQANITSVGTLTSLSVSGNATAGNLLTGGDVSVTGNILGGNLSVTGTISGNIEIENISSIVGNVTAGNLLTGGVVSATGNVTGANILTGGIVSATGNVRGANLNTVGVVSATGNVDAGNVLTAGLISSTGNITGGNLITSGTISATGNINAGNVNATDLTGTLLTPTQNYITQVGTLHTLVVESNIANYSGYVLDVANNVHIGGNLQVDGNLVITGNVQQITGNSGQFFGNLTTGFGALYAGIGSGYNVQPDTVLQVAGNYNEFIQIEFQNINSGDSASTDYVATADNGTNYTFYVDVGIAGSGYTGLSANSLGPVVKPNDAFLYTVGNGANAGGGGNLVISTASPGKLVKIVGAGGTDANVVAIFDGSNANVSVIGNVIATANVIGGNVTTAGLISSTGNATAGNILTGGLISSTGNVTGGNITTGGLISATGNATAGNFLTGGLISATGNVYTPRVLNGGTGLTMDSGFPGFVQFFNGSGSTVLIGDGGNISAIGNITGANILTGGVVSATGNIDGGNLRTAGLLSVTGTITASSTISTSGTVIASASLQATGMTGLYAGTTQADTIGTAKTSGTITVGGTAQTGAITVGQSTASQSLSLASGVTGSGNTKTISIGQGGASGSNTNITMGPSSGVGTANFGSGTTVAIANTSATALSVAGTIVAAANLQVGGGTFLYNTTTVTDVIGGSKTSGGINIGSTGQTGTLNIGLSTANSIILIGAGATGDGNTKLINIGGSGTANSITTFFVGPTTTAGGTGQLNIQNATQVGIANTGTLALSVAGTVTGNILSVPAQTNFNTSGTVTDQIGVNKTSGGLTIGSLSGTGNITIGTATTVNSTVNLHSAALTSGFTKTISIGQFGLAGSTTSINIGPTAVSGGFGLVTVANNATLNIANTGATALSVAGTVTGNNINATTTMKLAVFANTTVRDSSITSPTAGMMVYVTGTGMQVYGATQWNTVAGTAT